AGANLALRGARFHAWLGICNRRGCRTSGSAMDGRLRARLTGSDGLFTRPLLALLIHYPVMPQPLLDPARPLPHLRHECRFEVPNLPTTVANKQAADRSEEAGSQCSSPLF